MRFEHKVRCDVTQLLELRRERKLHVLISGIKSAETIECVKSVYGEFLKMYPPACRIFSWLVALDEDSIDELDYLYNSIGVSKKQMDKLREIWATTRKLTDEQRAAMTSMKSLLSEYTDGARTKALAAFKQGEGVTLTHADLAVLLEEEFTLHDLYGDK